MDKIPEHYTTTFDQNWRHLAQQKAFRLKRFVTTESFTGENKRFNRLAEQSFSKITQRKGKTRITNPDSDFRWITNDDYDLSNDLDESDARRLGEVVSPTGDWVRSHAAGYNRLCDDIVIGSALNPSIAGKKGTDSVDLPAGNIIGKDVGAGTDNPLNLDKLLAAREFLDDADIDEEEGMRVMVVTSKQITDMLKTTEITNSDFAVIKALAQGHVDSYMGFTFVRIKRLPKTGNVRRCPFWITGALKLNEGGHKSHIDILPGEQHKIQVRSVVYGGGVRMDDAMVGAIDCVEA